MRCQPRRSLLSALVREEGEMRQLGCVAVLALVGLGFAIPVAAVYPGELAAPRAASSAEDPPSPPARSPEERVTIEFGAGSSRLSNAGKAKLDEAALEMKQDPDLRAQVLGYTDASGSPEDDQQISERRAETLKNYLVTRHGIDPSRITTEGKGSADSTGDPAKHRRAVLTLTDA